MGLAPGYRIDPPGALPVAGGSGVYGVSRHRTTGAGSRPSSVPGVATPRIKASDRRQPAPGTYRCGYAFVSGPCEEQRIV